MSGATYNLPTTLAQAWEVVGRRPGDCAYLAGGTDLLLHRKHRLHNKPHLIDLSEIAELRQVKTAAKTLTIGAGVTLAELEAHPAVGTDFPLLRTAAGSIATPVLRQTATVGGNLLVQNRCNYYNQSPGWRLGAGGCLRAGGEICLVTGTDKGCYSRNVSDLAPALIVLEAQVTIRRPGKTETVPLIKLYAPDGLKPHRHLDGGAIITRIGLPRRPRRTWFSKLRTRRSLDFTSLTVAAAIDDGNRVRVCLNGVSPAPVLLEGKLPELSLTDLQRRARRLCQTVDNDHMPLKYRRAMIDEYLSQWWGSL